MKLARSLNPPPDVALELKEAEAQRLADRPPAPRLQIVAGLDSFASRFGMDETHTVVTRWARENRPTKIRNPASPKAKARATGDALFRKGGEGA